MCNRNVPFHWAHRISEISNRNSVLLNGKRRLTLNMTTAQPLMLLKHQSLPTTPIQDYVHPDDHAEPTYEVTLVFKPFTVLLFIIVKETHPLILIVVYVFF